MPILNYTTEVPTAKSAGVIMGLLASKGAKAIGMEYENGEPSALAFKIEVHGADIAFRLPCNWKGVLDAMTRDRKVERRYRNADQAKRVAWRIIKDWVEAQLAIVESQQAEIAEVFMPYALTGSGQTLFQRFIDNPGRLLGPGRGQEENEANVIEGDFKR